MNDSHEKSKDIEMNEVGERDLSSEVKSDSADNRSDPENPMFSLKASINSISIDIDTCI